MTVKIIICIIAHSNENRSHFLNGQITPGCIMSHHPTVVGMKGRVISFDADCKPAYRSQLLALGLRPRAEFLVLRQAPLGDPLVVSLNNDHLTLRKAELSALNIEWISNESEH